jgi:hypothetical protein
MVSESKPYKGTESYQTEDAGLFFGRDREAEQLIAKILATRFTLLHAQSAAGKTSLLNARVIPGLEARGWHAPRAIPNQDPTLSLRMATLGYVLPPPEAERNAVIRAVQTLGEPDEDLTIDEVLFRYDRLEERDPHRRLLISRVPGRVGAGPGGATSIEQVMPYFCRLLRSSLTVEAFSEHMTAIWRQRSNRLADIGRQTTVKDVLSLISAESFAAAYAELLEELNVPGNDLAAFFGNLVEVYGTRRSRFSLALILDQFEELFTRFVASSLTAPADGRDLPDWRLRWEFFDQLERLYNSRLPVTGASSDDLAPASQSELGGPLPIHIVISMRDEYIAQLDPIREFVGPLDENSYHLRLLDKEQAAAAIKEPARLFHYDYSNECYEQIIAQLVKEERFVEPAHLQLVCERLWNAQGRKLSQLESTWSMATHGEGSGVSLIGSDTFEQLKGVKGILDAFFRHFLEELPEDQQLETLEMLELLVTSGGTRNIVETDRLVKLPFRDEKRRLLLLDKLVDHTIVRRERRLGAEFAEITHEFLIGPILEIIGKTMSENVDYGRFRLALGALVRLYDVRLLDNRFRSLLNAQEFATLHANRALVRWNDWSTELMFRSAIALNEERETLRHWSREVDSFCEEEAQGNAA